MNVAVYTANFGGYDRLLEPLVVNESVDYLYFTDAPVESSIWQVILVEPPCNNLRHSSRYYFDQSCLVAPQYDITLMHGANSQMIADPVEIINQYLPDDIDMAAFRHPHRDSVFAEFDAVISLGKDTRDRVERQKQRYIDDGFKDDVGLSACIFLIRRRTSTVAEFERLWWNEVRRGSHRDQLSFDYIRWKTGIQIAYIPGDCFSSNIIKVNGHG